jgi:hypothetical protein
MLAPMLIELLIATLLFLLIGWAIDTVHASTRGSPPCDNFDGYIERQAHGAPRICSVKGARALKPAAHRPGAG